MIFALIFLTIGLANAFPSNWRPGVHPNTIENLEKLKNLKSGELAWVHSGQYQGDIVLSPEQVKLLQNKNGIININQRWPKTIPYVLDSTYTWEEQQFIRRALNQMELYSCLKFVPRTNEEDYVDITAEEGGCFAYVGRSSGRNRLNISKGYNGALNSGCMSIGTIQHEMLHTLGFHHMQSSYDRDDYVYILWDNISQGAFYNFEAFNDTIVTHFGIKYDYESVMHYHAISFSLDGGPTIITKDPKYQNVIGQDVGLSLGDIERLNRMYECPDEF